MTSRVSRRIAMTAVALAAGLIALTGSHVRSAAGPDLSRFVAVGDSLTAGYQNDSLLATQQVNGPASLIADQAGVALPLPLIAPPGVPGVILSVTLGLPPDIVRAPNTSTGRLNPLEQPMNLAVPGHTVHDALNKRPGPPTVDNLFTNLVLGFPTPFVVPGPPRSQVEWAEALSPTTILLWIGPDDAVRAVLAANPIALTPPASFEADYKEVIERLHATNATIVVANIPDVTRVPFLTSAEAVAALAGVPLAAIAPLLGIGAGDSITPQGLALIPAILANPALGPLPAGVVLTASEAATVRAVIDAYNAIIAREAGRIGATFVDVHELFESIREQGHVVLGRRLTTEFLGGIFSLDGLHPTNTGNALIANLIIKEMNRQTAAGIPPLSIASVAADDPLVPAQAAPGSLKP